MRSGRHWGLQVALSRFAICSDELLTEAGIGISDDAMMMTMTGLLACLVDMVNMRRWSLQMPCNGSEE